MQKWELEFAGSQHTAAGMPLEALLSRWSVGDTGLALVNHERLLESRHFPMVHVILMPRSYADVRPFTSRSCSSRTE